MTFTFFQDQPEENWRNSEVAELFLHIIEKDACMCEDQEKEPETKVIEIEISPVDAPDENLIDLVKAEFSFMEAKVGLEKIASQLLVKNQYHELALVKDAIANIEEALEKLGN